MKQPRGKEQPLHISYLCFHGHCLLVLQPESLPPSLSGKTQISASFGKFLSSLTPCQACPWDGVDIHQYFINLSLCICVLCWSKAFEIRTVNLGSLAFTTELENWKIHVYSWKARPQGLQMGVRRSNDLTCLNYSSLYPPWQHNFLVPHFILRRVLLWLVDCRQIEITPCRLQRAGRDLVIELPFLADQGCQWMTSGPGKVTLHKESPL